MAKKTFNKETGTGWKLTKSGWKFYEKNKLAKDQNPGITKLRKVLIDNTISMPFRGAKNLLKIGDVVTKPLQSGAKTIYQKGTLDPTSQEEFGEALTIFEANRRREQKSIKNRFVSDQKKAQDFFGTGDKADASLKENTEKDLAENVNRYRKLAKDGRMFSAVNTTSRESQEAAELARQTEISFQDSIEIGEKAKLSKEPTYKEVLGMKRGKKRDELTLKHWTEQGYNFDGLSKQDKRDLANELRIRDKEFTGTKGTFIHYGQHRFEKQKKDDLKINNTMPDSVENIA
jgi:hypothetical protein